MLYAVPNPFLLNKVCLKKRLKKHNITSVNPALPVKSLECDIMTYCTLHDVNDVCHMA